MERSADISADGRLRWTLARDWSGGGSASITALLHPKEYVERSVLWIMLNPSTADASVDDPTIKNIIERTHNWGFGKLVVVNLYPIRSSSPSVAKGYAQTSVFRGEREQNGRRIRNEARRASLVVAAWGSSPFAVDMGQRVWSMLNGCRIDLYCIGTTKSGAPKHPLARGANRVPVNIHYQPWQPWED